MKTLYTVFLYDYNPHNIYHNSEEDIKMKSFNTKDDAQFYIDDLNKHNKHLINQFYIQETNEL